MKQKTIIFSLLLTAMLLVGCGRNMDSTDPNTPTENATMITQQEAIKIALEKVPGATEDNIYKFEKDTDDSIVKYEGEVHYNEKEYEFEIHAYDGTILEWDEEPLHGKTR